MQELLDAIEKIDDIEIQNQVSGIFDFSFNEITLKEDEKS